MRSPRYLVLAPLRPRNRGARWPPKRRGLCRPKSLTTFFLPPRTRPTPPQTRCCCGFGRKAAAKPWSGHPAAKLARQPAPDRLWSSPTVSLGLIHPRLSLEAIRLLASNCLLEVCASPQTAAGRKCVFLIAVTAEKISNHRRFLSSLKKENSFK